MKEIFLGREWQRRTQPYTEREMWNDQAEFWNSRGLQDQIIERVREIQGVHCCFIDYSKVCLLKANKCARTLFFWGIFTMSKKPRYPRNWSDISNSDIGCESWAQIGKKLYSFKLYILKSFLWVLLNVMKTSESDLGQIKANCSLDQQDGHILGESDASRWWTRKNHYVCQC